MFIKLFAPSIRILLLTVVLSLLFCLHLTSSPALAQEITALDPAVVYRNCIDRATASGISPDSCRTQLPHEAQYSDCMAQAIPLPSPAVQNCATSYVNSVTTDYLNSCLINYPSQTDRCQSFYSPASNFAICLTDFKNPTECDRYFGFNLTNTSTRDTTIQSNTFSGVNPLKSSIGDLIANALQIVFIFAAIFALIFVVIGAFKWIISGGDKEAIAKARATIIHAFIGLFILSLAFFLSILFGQILGIDISNLPQIPTLNQIPIPFNP